MKPWQDSKYKRISSAEKENGFLLVSFENGDAVRVPITAINLHGEVTLDWNQLSCTPFEIVVPSQKNELAIPWDKIRAITDRDFSQYLAKQSEEVAKKVGAKIRALREKAGLKSGDLAQRSGLTPQTISRIETGKTDVGYSTLTKILSSMGYGLKDLADFDNPTEDEKNLNVLIQKLIKVGIDENFLLSKIFPKNVSECIRDGEREVPQLMIDEALLYLKKIYDWSDEMLWSKDELQVNPLPIQSALFKRTHKFNFAQIKAYSHYAYHLSSILIKARKNIDIVERPVRASDFIDYYYNNNSTLNLKDLLNVIWDYGIVVLPLDDSGIFHGASWNINGNHAIVIKQVTTSHARWIFDLLHELYHTFAHLDDANSSIIEEEELSPFSGSDNIEEMEANTFSNTVIFGKSSAEDLTQLALEGANWEIPKLKQSVKSIAMNGNVGVDFLANYIAFRLSAQGQNWWGTASNLQIVNPHPFEITRNVLLERISLGKLDPIEVNILKSALNF